MVDLAVSAEASLDFSQHLHGIRKALDRANQKPVRKTCTGTIISAGPQAQIIECDVKPASGRLWLVNHAVILGSDAHTNVGASLTPPAIPATTVAQANFFPYQVAVNVQGGTVTAIAVNGNATGLTSGTVWVPAGGSITLTYSAAPTWTWTEAYPGDIDVGPIGTQAFIDIYAGAEPDPVSQLGPLPIVILTSMPIPSTKRISSDVWVPPNTPCYGLMYNVPTGQPVELFLHVLEYPVPSEVSMVIS